MGFSQDVNRYKVLDWGYYRYPVSKSISDSSGIEVRRHQGDLESNFTCLRTTDALQRSYRLPGVFLQTRFR